MSINRLVLTVSALALSMTASAEDSNYVDGDPEAGKSKAQACAACHGPKGRGEGKNPEWPSLAGQHPKYLYEQLKLYKSKERNNQVMWGQAGNLSDQDMKDLSAYFAQQEPAVAGASEGGRDEGEAIYRGGIPEKGVPACAACHGPSGTGNPGVPYPRLGGQKATYTAQQLTAYREGERGDYEAAQVMNDIAANLSDEEIQAVSSYIAGLYVEHELYGEAKD